MNASTVAMNESAIVGWPARNQRWLSERFAFWRERLERPPDPSAPAPAPAFDDPTDFQPAALQIRSLFGLTTFETELLVLAAGRGDRRCSSTSRRAAQHMTPGQPFRLSFSLALALLPEPHWDAVSPIGSLRYWPLLEFDTTAGLAQAALRIDERVLHYLTGVTAFDERLAGVARLDASPPTRKTTTFRWRLRQPSAASVSRW